MSRFTSGATAPAPPPDGRPDATPDAVPDAVPAATRNGAALVTVLCWVIVVFDGYDLIVYGTVLPRLLQEPGWELSKSAAGLLGSLAFAGMLVGAVLAGRFADQYGRRRTILACTVWFSVFTALCALAPGPGAFGALRLLAGVGLGGLVPSANALAAEYVRARNRSVASTLMMSGVPIGGVLASVTGIFVMPRFGWQAMFLIALLGLAVVVPVCVRLLPESAVWLRTEGRDEEARALERRFALPRGEGPAPAAGLPADSPAGPAADSPAGPATDPATDPASDPASRPGSEPVSGPAAGRPGLPGRRRPLRALLRAPYTAATIVFSLATVTTLFAWYGLATWLPQLMVESGFDLGSSLTFLLALNLGAVTGSLLTAWAGTRLGPVPTAVTAAGLAAAGLAVLLLHPATWISYGALVLAGVGTHGTQCLIIAAVADHYPPRLRGSALGFSLGFGRIGAVLAPQTGGWLLAAGLGVDSDFLVFALGAAVAALLLTLPRGTGATTPGPLTAPANSPASSRTAPAPATAPATPSPDDSEGAPQ
ncbi:MFS transporter [Streptomyces sp. HNM0575]|uniref:MFS transporter n=1 Tax=Streptomyces sp. HNM0575 TaxID=2716338 RepID=UPI00145EA173|nr:MFS transporter [Streptomyces sp. HNM0575]NLU71172.1 MFS transporter [Streptomyces sp. HNM0575]